MTASGRYPLLRRFPGPPRPVGNPVVHGAPRPRRRGSPWATAGLTFTLVVAVVAGGGAFLYDRLTDTIAHSPLTDGLSALPDHPEDAQGRTPLNILVIGSDSRSTADDCALGGSCAAGGDRGGANADVQLLVHVTPDRTSATVTSIPRDTIVDVPRCKDRYGRVRDARTGRIGNTLQAAPSCTVAAASQLTGMRIDHFVLVDFRGVVSLSNALGGVDVCVDGDVYDPYSGLKLAAGRHSLVGVPALQFLRTRHGFGNGSDLGRQQAQQAFLASMVTKLTSAGTLANPGKVLSLVNAATKAVTVDDDLASVPALLDLANILRQVPPAQLTFTTMPTVPSAGGANTVDPAPEAAAYFDRLRNGTPQPLTPPQAPPPVVPALAEVPPAVPSPAQPVLLAPTPGAAPAPSAEPGCIPVARGRSTHLGTPAQAYAASPEVPDSAPRR
ncbi:LCP family protein [Rhodococcus sp. X156]|uniref:LCP family protein n=1 Tax=Rhodococcus sp. X156 TaxID=2499145 RepID=UPI0013E4029B|nr:LCP family protein [Rhodococcus sp. X156]